MVIDTVAGQLEQFAFYSALVYARNAPETTLEELELIQALSDSYGDAGYFQGNQATIVYAALTTLGVKIE